MDNFEIRRLGQHGDGIADGPVFASGALPGETVTGVLDGNRLTQVRIVTPSENRVKPPCSHAKSCGGCQLQHASDGFVANWKRDVVRQALAALFTKLRQITTLILSSLVKVMAVPVIKQGVSLKAVLVITQKNQVITNFRQDFAVLFLEMRAFICPQETDWKNCFY